MKQRLPSLILAAEILHRIGAFKPLLPLGGQTVIETLINRYRSAGISDMLVVLGQSGLRGQNGSGKAAHFAGPLMNTMIRNVLFHSGRFEKSEPGNRRFFLQPATFRLSVRKRLAAFINIRREKKAGICYPCHEGRQGYPPLIARR